LAFLAHVLHETDDPLKALNEAKRIGRKRVVVLEWPYIEEEEGPPLEHRLKPEVIEELARDVGFLERERIKLNHMDLYRFTVL
jgi:tRNA A37 threonylcarbamoyladenosine biosynthesis protein TsaE